MDSLIMGYAPTELMVGGNVVTGCARGGQVVYRKKNANYAVNYGDNLISTDDTVYSQIKNMQVYGKSTVVDDEIISTGDGGELSFTSCGRNFLDTNIVQYPHPLLGGTGSLWQGKFEYNIPSATSTWTFWKTEEKFYKAGSYLLTYTATNNHQDAISLKVAFYNRSGTKITDCSMWSDRDHSAFELEEDAYFIRFVPESFLVGEEYAGSFLNLMMSLSDSPYEPYQVTTATLTLLEPLRGVQVETGGNYIDDDGQEWLCDVLDAQSGVITRYLDSELNIIETPTTETIDTTALKKLRCYAGQTNLFADSDCGIKADFRINIEEQTEITDNIVQFDNALVKSATVEAVVGENLLDGTSVELTQQSKYNAVVKKNAPTLLENTEYTFSYEFDQLPDDISGVELTVSFIAIGETARTYIRKPDTLSDNLIDNATFSLDFNGKIPQDGTTDIRMSFRPNALAEDTITVSKNLKLELGSVATPWIPSPTDQANGVEMPTFELTRCGRNLFETKGSNFQNLGATVADGKVVFTKAGMYFNFFSYPQPYPTDKMYTHSVFTDIDCMIKIGNTASYSETETTQIKQMTAQTSTIASVESIGLNSEAEFFSRDYIYNQSTEYFEVTVSIMTELGSIAHDYEPYIGNTFTITPNTPTEIPLIDGVNTLFADADVELNVKYYSVGEPTMETAEALNLLGVNPSNTSQQQINQLAGMGVQL